jgi:hypothetical protein
MRDVQDTTLRLQVAVDAPVDQAFRLFTEGIGAWFPPEYNLLAVLIAERVFELLAGGRVYDRGVERRPAKLTSGSWQKRPVTRAWSSSIGISNATVRAGNECATIWRARAVGRDASAGLPSGFASAAKHESVPRAGQGLRPLLRYLATAPTLFPTSMVAKWIWSVPVELSLQAA